MSSLKNTAMFKFSIIRPYFLHLFSVNFFYSKNHSFYSLLKIITIGNKTSSLQIRLLIFKTLKSTVPQKHNSIIKFKSQMLFASNLINYAI